MNQQMTLNDGTVIENCYAIESNGFLYVYVRNSFSLREVFNIFIDPEKTASITSVQFGETLTATGYTKLIAVRDEGNGLITATLTKPQI